MFSAPGMGPGKGQFAYDPGGAIKGQSDRESARHRRFR